MPSPQKKEWEQDDPGIAPGFDLQLNKINNADVKQLDSHSNRFSQTWCTNRVENMLQVGIIFSIQLNITQIMTTNDVAKSKQPN